MKRIISVLLALAMMSMLAVGLTACGESETESKASESETPVGSETKVDSEVSEADTTANESSEEVSEEPENEVPEFENKQLKSITKEGVDGRPLEKHTYDEAGNLTSEEVYGDTGTIETETIYDNNGNVLSKIYYNEDGSIESETRYAYNESGNLLYEYIVDNRYTEYTYDADGDLLGTTEWKAHFNEQQQAITNWWECAGTKCDYSADKSSMSEYYWSLGSIFIFSDDPYAIYYDIKDSDWKLSGYYEYTYYDNGMLESEHDYNSEKNLMDYVTYAYDDNGNISEEKHYSSDLTLSYYTDYEYTDSGYTEINYNGASQMTKKTTYDNNGEVISSVSYDDGEITSETTSTFWSNGKLKSVITEENGKVTSTEEYDYCGNLLDDGSGTIYEYTYDEAGNMLTERIIKESKTTEYNYVNEYYD